MMFGKKASFLIGFLMSIVSAKSFAYEGHPVMAVDSSAVSFVKKGGSYQEVQCSGVRISRNLILTAAHCLFHGGIEDMKATKEVLYLVSDTPQISSQFTFQYTGTQLPPHSFVEIRRPIKNIVVHPTAAAAFEDVLSGTAGLGKIYADFASRRIIENRQVVDMALIEMGDYEDPSLRYENGRVADVVLSAADANKILESGITLMGLGYGKTASSSFTFTDGQMRRGFLSYAGSQSSAEFYVVQTPKGPGALLGDSGSAVYIGENDKTVLGVVSGELYSALDRWVKWKAKTTAFAHSYRLCDLESDIPELKTVQRGCGN